MALEKKDFPPLRFPPWDIPGLNPNPPLAYLGRGLKLYPLEEAYFREEVVEVILASGIVGPTETKEQETILVEGLIERDAIVLMITEGIESACMLSKELKQNSNIPVTAEGTLVGCTGSGGEASRGLPWPAIVIS